MIINKKSIPLGWDKTIPAKSATAVQYLLYAYDDSVSVLDRLAIPIVIVICDQYVNQNKLKQT